MKAKILSIIALCFTQYSYALVDYSETEGYKSSSSTRKTKRSTAPRITQKAPPKTRAASSGGPTMLEFSTSFEQQKVSGHDVDGNVNKVSFSGHIQTQYNLYLDFSYWAASNKLNTMEEASNYEQGRPEFILGFNWLRFGAAQEMATVDIYGGATFKGKDDIASTRTDKIVGIETSKRFYDFAVAIGYEYVLSGSTTDPLELSIGNISTLKTSLAWVVSGDINFVLEGGMVSVGDDSASDNTYKLLDEAKFSYVKPSLNLGLSRSINFEMGGVFRTRRAKDVDTLVDAKLWNVPGAYGNSLFAGLNFSI